MLVVALDKQDGFAAAQQVEQRIVQVAAAGHHLIVPRHRLGIKLPHPHALVVDARAGKRHIVGVIDEGAIGAHLLQHVPQCAHDAAVDKRLGVIDQDGSIGHGIKHGADVIQHRLLAITQSHERVFVLIAHAGEHQLAVLAQHLVLGEHFLPFLDGDVEFGLGELHLLTHELVGLIVHQLTHLIAEHDVEQLVKLGLGNVFDLRIRLIHAVEQVVNRAGQRLSAGR